MDYPQRKRMRLENRDYSENGAYFITICTKNKEEILSEIVGCGAHDAPSHHSNASLPQSSISMVNLTDIGKIVQSYIISTNCIRHVLVEQYVIMPNHIHMIVAINNPMQDLELSTMPNGTSRAPSPTNARQNQMIPHLVSTLKRLVNHDVGYDIFQRSYHDHIIRNEAEYRKIAEYIANNPQNWKSDCFHPDNTKREKPI